MQYSVFVCGNSIANAGTLKTLKLSSNIIQQHCNNDIETKQIAIIWLVNTNNAGKRDISVKVDFVVQKIGGIVMLPEGLAYSVRARATDQIIKTFGFSFINKANTRIYLHQIMGRFKAYAKIVRDEDMAT